MSKKRNPSSEALAAEIMKNYKPETVEDMQDALKDIFGPLFEAMLEGELTGHLGYEKHSKNAKSTNNRRNGSSPKTLKTSYGEVEINSPRDRDGSFEPELIKKRQTDVSAIENKVLGMYARGMSQRDISQTIEEIYGFSISHEMISEITDKVLEELEEWQQRPLKKCYTFLFVDCLFTKVRNQYETKEYAVYTILGYSLEGKKEILGLWLNETESNSRWMQIFDEIKARGVEDIFFISMDGVSGLEEGARSIFPNVVIQRCVVHLIRNSLRYVPTKDYKAFTASLKKVYAAPSLKACLSAFEAFKQQWTAYPGAIAVWERNFSHVEQLFDYGSDVRRIMYTTNPVESIHSSFRKVMRKGAFPNENALLKLLYLRIKELGSKWQSRKVKNWSLVLNQLINNESMAPRIEKYLGI